MKKSLKLFSRIRVAGFTPPDRRSPLAAPSPGAGLLILFLSVSSLSLWAADFGLILDQTASYGGSGSGGNFDYNATLMPRFSAILSDNSAFFVSAGINFQADPLAVIPELLRTEFSFNFSRGEFRAGRIYYSDPLGFIAEGLFDGAEVSFDTQAGVFSAGAWYTGFLYKKRARIEMTDSDRESNAADLNYRDFLDTYFAPRRALAALNWESPGLFDFLRVKLSLLGQYDFSDAELHSQYFAAKLSAPFNSLVFSAGACVSLTEDSGDIGLGLAGELGLGWMLPTSLEDRLTLLGRFSSGGLSGTSIEAFQPITTEDQGNILQARLSGLSMISLDYTARVLPGLSAGISSAYFIRSDLATYTVYGGEGYFLGNEFFGRLKWSPFSDLQINLGGGVFLPLLGNADPNAPARWRVELNVILALY